MKKIYIQPATLLTEVAVQQIICGSNQQESIKPNETVDDIGSLQSRQGFSIWGDDDEE
ncbi:MAG: hypothetical protein J6Z14_04960 [Prevotella sp.]|nr:hypothetical protein [Prevotella sp.]